MKLGSNVSESFQTTNGLRQGDALACILFNIALEKAVKDSGINTAGTIFNRSSSTLAYADDLDIVGRTPAEVKDGFANLERAAADIGLKVNAEKTKCMKISNPSSFTQRHEIGRSLNVGQHEFECTNEFVYLGTLVNSRGTIAEEIQR